MHAHYTHSTAGYFQSARAGDWAGGIDASLVSSMPPDEGPPAPHPTGGVVAIGATPWVVNYNVPLATADLSVARRIARAVSTRGGGPAGIEAAALPHGPHTVEIATNLTGEAPPGAAAAGPADVQAAVAAAAKVEGLSPPSPGYNTNLLPAQLVALAHARLPQGC